MNVDELKAAVEEMLGFTVQERGNDAVLVRTADPNGHISVRPATKDEVVMFLRLLGTVARLREATDALTALQAEDAYAKMGIALQTADARIKELMTANKGLGEERAFLGEVHRERIISMQAKHDASLIAAAERMQEQWLAKMEELEVGQEQVRQDLESELRNAYSKLEHAEQRAESAEDMAAQLNSRLTDAEEELNAANKMIDQDEEQA